MTSKVVNSFDKYFCHFSFTARNSPLCDYPVLILFCDILPFFNIALDKTLSEKKLPFSINMVHYPAVIPKAFLHIYDIL